MYAIEDHWDYGQIVAAARYRIGLNEARGGDYAVVAREDERILQEHLPESRRRGDACAWCGEPWPCGMVASIFTPD